MTESKPRAIRSRAAKSRGGTSGSAALFQLRVGDVIARLLPSGSRGTRADPARPWADDRHEWASCPDWPPDLFAVAATLVQKSGAYAYRSHDLGRRGTFDQAYLRLVTDAGGAWRDNPATPPVAAHEAWLALFEWMDEPLEPASADWWIACLKLMAIADEAAWGMGYVIDEPPRRTSPPGAGHGSELPRESSFAATVVQAYQTFAAQRRVTAPLVHIPNSLCWRVPTGECCVLPKARTPQVGITLAAFSHHLALLPSATEVRPRWLVNPVEHEVSQNERETFNLLLVPYPYRIHGTAFVPVPGLASRGRGRRFDIQQEWLSTCGPGDFAGFVTRLIEAARREVGEVHGVALPELALDAAFFKALGARWQRQACTCSWPACMPTRAMPSPTRCARRCTTAAARRSPRSRRRSTIAGSSMAGRSGVTTSATLSIPPTSGGSRPTCSAANARSCKSRVPWWRRLCAKTWPASSRCRQSSAR